MPAPLPSVQAILICDMVIKEAQSNKHSAIGIFTDVFASQFPMTLHALAVYANLTDALGMYSLSVELRDLSRDKVLGRVQGLKFQSRDKLATHDFGIRFVNTVFPSAGVYEFRLLADDRLLGAKKLRVNALKKPESSS
ncbi:MAG: DUF6941 family protein [Planctomycetota bacterium]|jgi:hypothetical protein